MDSLDRFIQGSINGTKAGQIARIEGGIVEARLAAIDQNIARLDQILEQVATAARDLHRLDQAEIRLLDALNKSLARKVASIEAHPSYRAQN